MPATANVHIDALLTDVASGYTNSDYIGTQVLPVIPVTKESGKIGVYGQEHYRIDFTARGIGSDTPRGEWQASTPLTFAADEWTFEIPVDDRERAYYDDPFDADRDATETVTQKILAKTDDVVGTLCTTGGNFGATAPAAVTWVTSATATPVKDIRTAMEAIRARTGVSYANMCAVMSAALYNKMIQTTEFKTLFLNTVPGAVAPGNTNPSMVAQAIGLKEVYVGSAVKLTSAEGAANTFGEMWGTTTVAVIVKSPRPNLRNPGWGAILAPTAPGFPKGATIGIDRYREERKKSDIIRATAFHDVVAVTAALGNQITGC